MDEGGNGDVHIETRTAPLYLLNNNFRTNLIYFICTELKMRQYFQTTIINVNVCFDLIGWHAVRCIGMHPNCSWLSMPWNCDRSLSSSNPQSISFTLTVYLNSIIQPIPRSCIGFCPAFLFLNIFHFNQKNVSNSRHWLVVYFTN